MRVEFGRRVFFHAAVVAAVTLAFATAISAFGAAPAPRPGLQKMLGQAKSQITQISVQDAHDLMARGAVMFLDVRSDAEYAAGHLPGATHVDRGKLEFMVEQTVPNKATPIVVYCKSGGRGSLATRTLLEMGYTNVRNMAGGYEGWAKAGFTVTK